MGEQAKSKIENFSAISDSSTDTEGRMPKRPRQEGDGDDTQYATSSTSSAADKKRVVFNVSGQRFETNIETLTKFPRTMLGM